MENVNRVDDSSQETGDDQALLSACEAKNTCKACGCSVKYIACKAAGVCTAGDSRLCGAYPSVCSMTSGAIQQGVPTNVLRDIC